MKDYAYGFFRLPCLRCSYLFAKWLQLTVVIVVLKPFMMMTSTSIITLFFNCYGKNKRWVNFDVRSSTRLQYSNWYSLHLYFTFEFQHKKEERWGMWQCTTKVCKVYLSTIMLNSNIVIPTKVYCCNSNKDSNYS